MVTMLVVVKDKDGEIIAQDLTLAVSVRREAPSEEGSSAAPIIGGVIGGCSLVVKISAVFAFWKRGVLKTHASEVRARGKVQLDKS